MKGLLSEKDAIFPVIPLF